MVGFPEKKKKMAVGERDQEPNLVYYNSVAFVDPQGHLVTTYAKTFLYYTDENWAEEGPGFKSIDVDGLGKVTTRPPFPSQSLLLNNKKKGLLHLALKVHS